MSQQDFNDSDFFSTIRRTLGKVPFLRDAMAAYYAMKDPMTPRWAKVLLAGALAYFVSPVDAIPDVIPVWGFLDDAGVIAAAIEAASGFITKEHYRMADRWFGGQARFA